MTKRERLYPEIKRLREDEGLMWREIGERVGLSLKVANEYYHDPTGKKADARKRASDTRLKQTCPRCGGTMGLARLNVMSCKPCYTAELRAARQCRLEDIAEMYRNGMSYREIADTLGYGPNSTSPDINAARRLGLIGYRYKACESRVAA